MANRIYIPHLLPTAFYRLGQENLSQHFHKTFKEYRFRETQQQPWSQSRDYYQPWQKSDIINYQFSSTFGNISLEVLDCYDIVKIAVNATQVRADKFNPGNYIYEASISLVDLPDGKYRIRTVLGDITEITDWMHVKTSWPNTIYIQYNHNKYHEGVFFESGIIFNLRVEGTIGRIVPGSSDVYMEDQIRNPHLLSSKPFTSFNLSIGGAAGVPDWMIHKLNYVFSCNNISIDGQYYAKSGDTKLEVIGQSNYPMQAIRMVLREAINRPVKIVEPNLDTNVKIAILSPVEGTVFGDLGLNAGSNVILVHSSE
jgi:hypothetical protein